VAHDIRLLQLAFTIHMAEQILGSDLDVVDEEAAWLHATFPPEMLRQTGLLGVDGHRTAAYEEARDVALLELPDALSEGEKLAVMEVLVGAAAADGLLAAEEANALAHAARLLGVGDREWASHLEQLIAAGQLRRDDAGA
jgi:hypothetical protein